MVIFFFSSSQNHLRKQVALIMSVTTCNFLRGKHGTYLDYHAQVLSGLQPGTDNHTDYIYIFAFKGKPLFPWGNAPVSSAAD